MKERKWLADLPKVDLHCHLDGSLNLETVRNLTGKQEISWEDLQAAADCDSLKTYLEKFDLPLLGMQTAEGLREAAKSFLLDLKKENVHLSEQYFDVIDSKTENGIRKVPIADKVLPFYQRWLHDCSDCEYLIHTLDSQHFTYYMYYHNVFQPLMFRLHIDHTPHCCRHTTISLLAEAHVDQTTIKKIVGHSGAMSLTERIYTHLDVPALVEAINQI